MSTPVPTNEATRPCAAADGYTRQPSHPYLRTSTIAPGMLLLLGLSVAVAAVLDQFGPPPPGDPSAFTDQPQNAEAVSDNLENQALPNAGSFEISGGVRDRNTPLTENALPPGQQTSFDIPTDGRPSPLFGAQPYTQQLLLLEEFGLEPFDPNPSPAPNGFPQPAAGPAPEQEASVARSGPAGRDLDDFLRFPGLFPAPSEFSNVIDLNPWSAPISAFLQRTVTSPAEGRPPGKGWSHQRFNEFRQQVSFKTVQAGARVNGGVRDTMQRHRYADGEFAPGGLYNTAYHYDGDVTVGPINILGTTRGIKVQIHPDMPVQDHKALWTFDGTFPPKLVQVRHGQVVMMRHYNALPIDPAANMGFGLHTLTTHLHNAHNPAESDGFANAFFFPGQFYDYRWPFQLAGYDSINTNAQDPRAAFPCDPGETLFVNDVQPGLKQCMNGRIQIRGDWRETMSTLWFHDHMLDFTAQNAYKGNGAMLNIYSAVDRGKEDLADGVNLRFPSGTALGWGNRDYDVNLMIADKAWDQQGQLWFNPFNRDGFLGDRMLVNWQFQPFMNVRARSYRFRILNTSVSRYFKLGLVQEVQGNGGEFPGPPGSGVSYNRVPFHMIANDGNIMEHAVPFDGSMDLDGDGDLQDDNAILPTLGVAERYDIVVNFGRSGINPGDRIYFVNLMEHDTGKGTKQPIPLANVLSERYKAVIKNADRPDQAQWDRGDPGVGPFMQFRVVPLAPGQVDLAMNPAEFEPAKPAHGNVPAQPEGKVMIPLTIDRDDPADQALLAQARHRSFEFGRSDGVDNAPWTIKTDGGNGFRMDSRRLSAAPQLATGPTPATPDGSNTPGTLEIWRLENGGGGWEHPIHIHFEEGILLSRGDRSLPEWDKWARKDVYRIGEKDPDASDVIEVALRFREFAGTFMEHCHNTQHEDSSMLLRWDAEFPGQVQLMPAPLPTWDGVGYVPSVALPTFRTGDGRGPLATSSGSGSSGSGSR